MCVCVKVLDPLELELQTVASCYVVLDLGPLEEQQMLITTEPSPKCCPAPF